MPRKQPKKIDRPWTRLPRKPLASRLSREIRIRLTVAEDERIKAAAEAAGLSVSDWARQVMRVACAGSGIVERTTEGP